MSGIEIAGLVLGALPVLCSAAKQLKPIAENVEWWWTFETSFENFISDIGWQEIAYRQVLKRLVGPLHIPEKEYQALITDPKSKLWHEPHIREGLQERFEREEYYWFMGKMRTLKESVEQLQGFLPGDKVYLLDSTTLESELWRLKTSFNNEKDGLLTAITTANNELHEFLDRAADIPDRRPSRPLVSFRDLQKQARQVYECLAKRWQCSCPVTHTVGIATHTMFSSSARATPLDSGYISLLLETGSGRKHIRVQISDVTANGNRGAAANLAPQDSTTKLNLETTGDLKRQMQVKKHQKSISDSVNKKNTATLVIPAIRLPNSQSDSASERRSILTRIKGKFMKGINIDAAAAGANLAIAAPSTPSRAMTTPTSAATLSQVTTKTSWNDSIGKSSSLSATSLTSTVSVDLPLASQTSQVRFADDAPAMDTEAENKNVMSLCQLGRTSDIDDCRTCIRLSKYRNQVTFAHERSDQDVLEACEVHGIDALLKGVSQRLERLSVGRQFALTLLSLANSAWVPDSLKMQDVFLICTKKEGPKGIRLSRPMGPFFLSHNSENIIQQETPTSNQWHAKSSLLLLGVILLELFHGEKLEQQDSWKDALEDGEPNNYTVLCSALLWALQAKESLEKYLGKEVGGSLADAILKCIRFDFGYDDDYGDAKLLDRVYEDVVVPLEKCRPPQVA